MFIPKPGRQEKRPLSIPTVRDRVVQAALKIVIEPVFEADFRPTSFGFRPKRSAHDALQVLLDESFRGKRFVVESDIADCFSAIPHEQLMSAVEERICDRKVLKLIRAMLRSGVMEDGAVRHAVTGTPQGGVISPLLCNVYLNRLDREWETSGHGVLVRYADDLVAMCSSRAEADRALARLTALLGDLGLCAEGGQDPDRAPGGGRRGIRLPRLPSPPRARPGPHGSKALRLPRPLALTSGGPACPRPTP